MGLGRLCFLVVVLWISFDCAVLFGAGLGLSFV